MMIEKDSAVLLSSLVMTLYLQNALVVPDIPQLISCTLAT